MVAAGQKHTLALRGDGTVWSWGLNGFGQLGNGNTTQQPAPVQVGGGTPLTGVQAIASMGGEFSVALKTDGTVWAWGRNADGELGNNAAGNSSLPVQVQTQSGAALTGVVEIAAGRFHALARKTDGTVWSWGSNGSGELGSGATSGVRRYAGQVTQLAQVKAITVGHFHGLAVRQDGTVWTWGRNDQGELGNGLAGIQPAPKQAVGVADIHSVAAGAAFSLALGMDGSIWSWGYNATGQLGDGTTATRGIPEKVNEAGAWRVGPPVFNPVSGALNAPTNVTLTSSTTGATIHYTTDGSEPVQGAPGTLSVANGGSVFVDRPLTLKARAYKSGSLGSSVASQAYTLNAGCRHHEPCGRDLPPAAAGDAVASVSGAVIRYTLDGSPVDGSSLILGVNGTVTVPRTTAINAKAFWYGPGGGGPPLASSPQSGDTWRTKVAASLLGNGSGAPGKAAGAFAAFGPVWAGVESISPSAVLRARSCCGGPSSGAHAGFVVGTTGGSGGNGGAFLVGRSTSVRAWGRREDGWDPGDTSRVSYFISRGPATAPMVQGSSFGSSHYARVSSTQPSSMFRYTLDGSVPTLRSPMYHGPVRVGAGGQFRARSFSYDHAPSASVSWNAPFNGILAAATPPTFDPPAGAYPSRRAVTLASATSGATIYYTTDGSVPTTSSPSVPSGGTVLVTRGLPLRAIAAAAGFDASVAARADYRITGKLVERAPPTSIPTARCC